VNEHSIAGSFINAVGAGAGNGEQAASSKRSKPEQR